jgi:peroxiredoxin
MGIARITYIVDGEGIVKKVYSKVKPETHGEELLTDLRTI